MFYICLHCDYETKQKQHVIEHSQKHINMEVDCDRCGQTFSRYNTLRRHKKNCSELWFPKFCRIEGKTFSYKDLVKIQGELFSRKEDGLYSCKHCDLQTKKRPAMVDHAQSHLQDLEVDCDVCGKTFTSFACLRYHKRRSCP